MTLFSKLIRTKDLRKLQGDDPQSNKPKLTVSIINVIICAYILDINIIFPFLPFFSTFQKCLTTLDLTSLGVGSCCGTGMYLVAGMVARNIAGPGVIFSFIIAAVASIFSGII